MTSANNLHSLLTAQMSSTASPQRQSQDCRKVASQSCIQDNFYIQKGEGKGQEADTLTDRQTGKQTDRPDRQTWKQTHRYSLQQMCYLFVMSRLGCVILAASSMSKAFLSCFTNTPILAGALNLAQASGPTVMVP